MLHDATITILLAIGLTIFSGIKTCGYAKNYWGIIQHQITESYHINENNKKVELLLLNLIHSSSIACAIVSPDGRMIPNQAFATILGWPLDELTGKTWMSITHQEYIDIDTHYLKQMLKGEITDYTLDKVYVDYNGNNVSARINVILSRYRNGDPHKFIVTITEIPDLLSGGV